MNIELIIILGVLGIVGILWALYMIGNRRIGDDYIPEYEAYKTRLHRNHRM